MSPTHPFSNGEKANRQLPRLSELLSPGLVHNDGASPGRLPSLTNGFATPTTASHSGAPDFARSHQTWHSLPAHPLPPSHRPGDDGLSRAMPSPYHMEDPHRHSSRASLPGQAAFPPISQRVSLSNGPVEFRGSLAPTNDNTTEDHRRDSARSNSTNSASNMECVGQQHFPGRGLCYVYSDGATCPTVIDGELVNPLWGTTKAGKARKRLAQACLTCREKKIRCEPKHPRCLQCEKAKRECIMPAPQQGGQDQMSMAMNSGALPALTPAPYRHSPTESSSVARQLPVAKRQRSDENYTVSPSYHVKQEHSTVPIFADRYADRPHLPHGPSGRENGTDRWRNSPDHSDTNSPTFARQSDWRTDPWEVSPNDTARLLDAFFSQNITISHSMFPRATFHNWVRSNRQKAPNECMVLYSVLGLGAAVSRDDSSFGRLCSERAATAIAAKFGKSDFLLAQARIFMSLVGHANGQLDQASEYYSAAVHALRVGKLHTEDGCAAAIRAFDKSVFDLTADQLMECMRRTFWAGFILDAVSAITEDGVCVVSSEIIRLRLPAVNNDYDQGLPSRASFFDTMLDTYGATRLDPAHTSLLCHSINISRILNGVGHFVYSAPQRPSPSYAGEYLRFLQVTDQQLSRWRESLPEGLGIDGQNLAVAAGSGATIIITSMAAVYHTAIIFAHRFVRHRLLDRSTIARNIQRAIHSAKQILKMASSLCTIGQNLPEGQNLQQLLSPFFAWGVFLAVDTLCAGGYLADIREVLTSVMHGSTTVHTIGFVWAFAKPRLRDIDGRIATLQKLFNEGEEMPPDVALIDGYGWRCKAPMNRVFDADNDLMYGIDGREYLHALR